MNFRKSKIYEQALEERKSKLRGEVDLCTLAIIETKKRIKQWLETDKTLANLQKTKSQTLWELSDLLNNRTNEKTLR